MCVNFIESTMWGFYPRYESGEIYDVALYREFPLVFKGKRSAGTENAAYIVSNAQFRSSSDFLTANSYSMLMAWVG